ncbi:MAG: thioredoxin family protein [Vampirovibrionales bacterium]|nr:thioredoxin family protein [Vampirovibrionales bacterium]
MSPWRTLVLSNPFKDLFALLWVLMWALITLTAGSLAWAQDTPTKDLKTLPRSMRDPTHPTVLVFHAPWCGTCKKMAPLEKKLEKRTHPTVQWRWFNTEDPASDKMMKRFNIHVTPTYLLFNADGKGVYRMEAMIRPAILRQEVLQLQAKAMPSGSPPLSSKQGGSRKP